MVPVPTEDFELDPPGSSIWQSLLNLAISVLVVCAAALLGNFLSVTSAHAQAASVATGEPRIGCQTSASLFVRQKARGSLEEKLAPLGFGVKWVEFPAGPQLFERLNVGAVDVGHVRAAPPIFVRAAGARIAHFGHDLAASPSRAGTSMPG